VALLLGLLALGIGGEPAWMQGKAVLSQWLLQRAWAESQASGDAVKPWPWADTHPVARITLPRLGVDEIVLAGDSGRVLAFGPGWAEASARPGEGGVSVISGHRDNHFAFLREVRAGDRLWLETGHARRAYIVQGSRIVDSRTQRLSLDGDAALTLVTCWPFDAITAGGPMRYVVTALPEEIATSARGRLVIDDTIGNGGRAMAAL